jgi:hypothetical protein
MLLERAQDCTQNDNPEHHKSIDPVTEHNGNNRRNNKNQEKRAFEAVKEEVEKAVLPVLPEIVFSVKFQAFICIFPGESVW